MIGMAMKAKGKKNRLRRLQMIEPSVKQEMLGLYWERQYLNFKLRIYEARGHHLEEGGTKKLDEMQSEIGKLTKKLGIKPEEHAAGSRQSWAKHKPKSKEKQSAGTSRSRATTLGTKKSDIEFVARSVLFFSYVPSKEVVEQMVEKAIKE